jgi:hypothetical protein
MSLNLPSPGFVSLLVSQVKRRYPLEDGKELVSISPRPDQDPACSQIIVFSAGLDGGCEHEGRRRREQRAESRGKRAESRGHLISPLPSPLCPLP